MSYFFPLKQIFAVYLSFKMTENNLNIRTSDSIGFFNRVMSKKLIEPSRAKPRVKAEVSLSLTLI